jgi:hypothetical protein
LQSNPGARQMAHPFLDGCAQCSAVLRAFRQRGRERKEGRAVWRRKAMPVICRHARMMEALPLARAAEPLLLMCIFPHLGFVHSAAFRSLSGKYVCRCISNRRRHLRSKRAAENCIRRMSMVGQRSSSCMATMKEAKEYEEHFPRYAAHSLFIHLNHGRYLY